MRPDAPYVITAYLRPLTHDGRLVLPSLVQTLVEPHVQTLGGGALRRR